LTSPTGEGYLSGVIVCHCLEVSDRAVRADIGAGATTIAEVRSGCGASSRCGGCTPTVHDLLVRARLGLDGGHADDLFVDA
jgi:bacterioferritin-associated ferredoxin